MASSAQQWHRADRRHFISGSDARIMIGDDEAALIRVANAPELRRFCHLRLDVAFLKRTPTPPPFSSMNSTPARFNTASMVESVSGSPAYRPTSMLVIVLRWRPAASAKSRTVQLSAALAILTCALVTGIFVVLLSHVHLAH